MSHHAASSRANQSQSLEVTDNDDEPIGDRWDDEEDWGSLEVRFHRFSLNMKIANYYVGIEYVRLCCVIMISKFMNCYLFFCLKGARESSDRDRWLEHWLVRNGII